MDSRAVGGLTVTALRDGRGPFLDWAKAFPGAGEREWELARAADPAAFAEDGKWWLDFRAFAIQGADGGVVLVDTGIGPAGAPASSFADTPGRLPSVLAEAGIAPEDVSTVVLTHLHTDHCGWAVDAAGTPTFPNARYILQRTETAWLEESAPLYSWAVRPLREAGQLDEVDGQLTLAKAASGETVTVFPTPGHTPGHQSVVVESRDTQLVVTGDVLVHAVQLMTPSVGYVYERDQELARRTREEVLARKAVFATPHLTEPFTEL
ncbi:MBL fold metallo-hydrolase [Actinocrispum sp. NPDC049592]|uniref:MBL fold metallo-hydrolase n=1 Tax=Actinocrispum sp. NPDC049592 TaxID=3154835 RepID=UPI003417A75B